MINNKDISRVEITEIPIDQYQRYRLASQVVEALRENEKTLRILEVGGFPPKLSQFLRDDFVVISDKMICKADLYVRADAVALPFKSESFDVVISLDVLEHIPAGDRLDFMESIKDVSADFVILAAPFDDGLGLIRDAESLLLEFISDRLGYEHQYFAEHLANGLPNLNEIRASFTRDSWETLVLPCGYFPRWFGMTLLEYALEGKVSEEVRRKMRRHYNLYFYPMDICEPAYRSVIIASRRGLGEGKRNKIRNLKSRSDGSSWPPMEYAKTLVELARLDAHDALLARIKELEHELSAREEEITHLKKYIEELENFTDRVKKLIPYRLYSKFIKPNLKIKKS